MNHLIFDSIRYATISTVSKDGLPWAAPVWYVHKDDFIYWWSPINSQHSLNIASNNSAYVRIFDSSKPEGEGSGLYIRAQAEDLTDPHELVKACELYNSSTMQFKLDLSNCSGDAPTRLYRAKVLESWVNSNSEHNWNYIDTRVPSKLG